MKRNCWTCAHNRPFGPRPSNLCVQEPPRREIDDWTDAVGLDDNLMPPSDADGCPGYTPAAPMMGPPEGYTAMHIPPPVDPQDRAQNIARPETEAEVYSPPEAEWDADDDGREIG